MKRPPVAISPAARSGVSAAYCVAAIDSPAFHPGMVRPARKYSSWLSEAFDRERKPAVTL